MVGQAKMSKMKKQVLNKINNARDLNSFENKRISEMVKLLSASSFGFQSFVNLPSTYFKFNQTFLSSLAQQINYPYRQYGWETKKNIDLKKKTARDEEKLR